MNTQQKIVVIKKLITADPQDRPSAQQLEVIEVVLAELFELADAVAAIAASQRLIAEALHKISNPLTKVDLSCLKQS